jgi:hypothetical protein
MIIPDYFNRCKGHYWGTEIDEKWWKRYKSDAPSGHSGIFSAAAQPGPLALKNEGDLKMRCIQIVLVISVLFFVGCEYESPLTKEHTISIDSSVLGLWELVPEHGKEPDPDERLLVLKYSDTEYLIHYPVGKKGMYFRGYPIKIGHVSCVQVEFIGAQNGPPDRDKRELFHVVSYALALGKLEIRILNTNLVSDELKDGKALRKALLKHQSNKDLFRDPGKFRKIKD